jgi:DNA replication licensing factor MCM5
MTSPTPSRTVRPSSSSSYARHSPSHPPLTLRQFESAATRAARNLLYPLAASNPDAAASAALLPTLQITLRAALNLRPFRALAADSLNRLVRVPGIVISASVLGARATRLHLQCRACRSVLVVHPAGGLGGVGGGSDRGLPRRCDAPAPDGQKKDCPLDPYVIVHAKSTFGGCRVRRVDVRR